MATQVNQTKKTNNKAPQKQNNTIKKGQYVVYPTHGVGRVVGTENAVYSGQTIELIIISFDHDKLILRVPATNVEHAGLRHLSSKDKMSEAVNTLKGKSRVKRTMWARRAQEYENKINSGNPIAIAEVVRDLFRSSAQPEQSFSERQIYQAALERLAREYAAIEEINHNDATDKLVEVLEVSVA